MYIPNLYFVLQTSKSDTSLPVSVDEKENRETPEKQQLAGEAASEGVLGEIIDEVIKSETTQPSVPAIVLAAINDIIMSDPVDDLEDVQLGGKTTPKSDVEDQEVLMYVADEGEDSPKALTPQEEHKGMPAPNGHAITETTRTTATAVIINGHAGGGPSKTVSPQTQPSPGDRPRTSVSNNQREVPRKLDLSQPTTPTSPSSPGEGPRSFSKRPSEERRMPQTPPTPASPSDDRRGLVYRSKESKDSRNEADRQGTVNRQVGPKRFYQKVYSRL